MEEFAAGSSLLFSSHSVLFGFKMTEILTAKDGGDALLLDLQYFRDPQQLTALVESSRKLTLLGESFLETYSPRPPPVSAPETLNTEGKALSLPKKRTPKKHEQVQRFCSFLIEKVDKGGIVVDVGSGVGHLTTELSHHFPSVYAIEQNPAYTKNYPESVKILNERVTDLKGLHKHFPEEKVNASVALVGLHPCGDLSPNCVEAFVSCESYKWLSIVSCCYHKMTQFKGPMSALFHTYIQKYPLGLLRLGSERRNLKFEEGVEEEAEQVLCRGVAEVLGIRLKKYQRLDVCLNQIEGIEAKKTFAEAYDLNRHWLPSIIVLLQSHAALQRLCELYILLDRQRYLQERGFKPVLFGRFFPESNTPRGEVLFAEKE